MLFISDLKVTNATSDGLSECPLVLIPDHDSFAPEAPPTPVPGPTGETGPTGPRGSQGLRGPTGPQGETGPSGKYGSDGPIGATGEQGETGLQGEDGEQGETGATGPTGIQGESGIQGEVGATGIRGEQGLAGEVLYADGKVAKQQQQKYFTSSWMHLIIVVWMLVFTSILTILAFFVGCWIRSHNNKIASPDVEKGRDNLTWKHTENISTGNDVTEPDTEDNTSGTTSEADLETSYVSSTQDGHIAMETNDENINTVQDMF